MTRKINIEKYERILSRIEKGESQKSIVIAERCSYGTISSAKQWDKVGRPTTIITTRNKLSNTSKIILSIPNYWLENLNKDIMSGIWIDYSDAIVDIIRTFYRIQMEENPKIRAGGDPKIRRKILGELKTSFKTPILEEVKLTDYEEKEKRKKKLENELKRITKALEKREIKEKGIESNTNKNKTESTR
ncbi:MAG: hypothetical protein ACFFC3_05195 [Candidatus Odinarchaeota archaeon]